MINTDYLDNCHFYKDERSNKIKPSEQIYIDKFRKTFRMIYNDIPISNNININFDFSIFPEEVIWKYYDYSSVPDSIEIYTNVPHIGKNYSDLIVEKSDLKLLTQSISQSYNHYYTII